MSTNAYTVTTRRNQPLADEECAMLDHDDHSSNGAFGGEKMGVFTQPWHRFIRKGKKNVGVAESLKAIVLSSCTSGLSDESDLPRNLILSQGLTSSLSSSHSRGYLISENSPPDGHSFVSDSE